jgi:hypothetical protein
MLTLSDEKAKNRAGISWWRRLVRIAYFDEAGAAAEEQEPFFVVGGVLIHGDGEWFPIEHRTRRIIETYVPEPLQRNFHFHAMHLFGDHKNFQGQLSAETRFQILRQLAELIAYFKLPVSYGAVTRSELRKQFGHRKKELTLLRAHQLAFVLCSKGLERWMNRWAMDEVAICVADTANKSETSLKELFRFLRDFFGNKGAGLDDLLWTHFIDALHFAGLRESIGLQLADCVAFLVKRHLMNKDDTEEFYDIIKPCLVCDSTEAVWPFAKSS